MSGLAELVSPEIAEVADEEELVTEAVRGGAVRGKVVEGEADGGGVAFAVPLGSDGVFLRFLDLVAGRSKDAGTCEGDDRQKNLVSLMGVGLEYYSH